MTLTQESLEKASSIHKLEDAATELYKALQAGRDTGEFLGDHCRSTIFYVGSFVFRHGRHHGKTR
jgi:hypothetical protein